MYLDQEERFFVCQSKVKELQSKLKEIEDTLDGKILDSQKELIDEIEILLDKLYKKLEF
jgi:hypothetical protein